MNCLEDNQIILYLTRFGLSKEKKLDVDNHLNGCEKCRKKKDKIERKINASAANSKRECELVRNNMAAYSRGELKDVAGINLEEHLNECETCRFLYSRNQKQLTLVEMEALNIPVPEGLLPNILTVVTEAMAGEETPVSLPEVSLSEKISEGLKKIINHVIIFLQPLEPRPAFRGRAPFRAKRINHTGGDLMLDVGEQNVTVRIFSMDDVELGEQQSDNQGRAIFKDFEKAEYKIAVEGYEIREVQSVKE